MHWNVKVGVSPPFRRLNGSVWTSWVIKWNLSCQQASQQKRITPQLMRNWQWPYVVTKCITTLYITYNVAPRPSPMWLWHYSGHNPPTWFSNKIGLRHVESNNQTEQSNNQTEQWQIGETRATHWFCLKWHDTESETESETESIAPELIQKDPPPLRQSGCSWQPPNQMWTSFLSYPGYVWP